jgi:dTDP-4-amino-4,6-dideoxygalactose transaminase
MQKYQKIDMKKIKLFDPIYSSKELEKISSVIKSGFWASGAGTGFVKEFEDKFTKFIGSKTSVAVNSGTAALHLALSLIDIKNKEVILPSLSFVSTAHAVLYNGGKPIFADINPNTLCIEPEEVLKKITDKTKVVLPVHFAGFSANMDKLKKICKKHNLNLLDDAAHACGTKYNSNKIGSVCEMSCFSFHPVKNLAMPTGGLITLNQSNYKKLKKSLESKRWCGITDRKESTYDVKELGWNYYMNEISAGIGLVQLEKLDFLNKKRKNIAKKFFNRISTEYKMPFNDQCSYHFYWILVKNREKFRKQLSKNGIETGIHYEPIHKMTLYTNKQQLPITEKISKEIVTLPTHPNLSNNDVDYIIEKVNKFLES